MRQVVSLNRVFPFDNSVFPFDAAMDVGGNEAHGGGGAEGAGVGGGRKKKRDDEGGGEGYAKDGSVRVWVDGVEVIRVDGGVVLRERMGKPKGGDDEDGGDEDGDDDEDESGDGDDGDGDSGDESEVKAVHWNASNGPAMQLTFDGFNFALQNPFSQDQTTSASLPPFGNASSPISSSRHSTPLRFGPQGQLSIANSPPPVAHQGQAQALFRHPSKSERQSHRRPKKFRKQDSRPEPTPHIETEMDWPEEPLPPRPKEGALYRQKDTDGAAVSVDSGDTPALRVSSDDDNGESEQIGYVGLFFRCVFFDA